MVKMLERFWHGCGHCQGQENCPLLVASEPLEPPTAEAKLPVALTAGMVFLLPLALAIVGASLAGRGKAANSAMAEFGECFGLLVGFAVGVMTAKILLYVLCRREKTTQKSEENA